MFVSYLSFFSLLLVVTLLPDGNVFCYSQTNQLNLIKKRTIIKLLIILGFIGLVSGTRDIQVGTDYYGYSDAYECLRETGRLPRYLSSRDYGWKILNVLAAKLQLPSPLFFGLIASLIWLLFITATLKHHKLHKLMLFFVITSGLFYWTLSGFRQSIAAMFTLISINFIQKKELHNFVPTIIIASLFHNSAILFLPFYLFHNIRYNRHIFIIIYIISVILIGNTWTTNIARSAAYRTLSTTSALSTYNRYLETSKFRYTSRGNNTGAGVILKIIFSTYILWKGKSVLSRKRELEAYYVLFFCWGSHVKFDILC